MTPARQPLRGWPSSLPRQEKRRAFLAGMMLLDAMADDPECRTSVLEELDFFLTQPRDRGLFGLPPLSPVCPAEDKPGLRALMLFQGPSFRDLLPPVTDAFAALWLTPVNLDASDASFDDLFDIMDATVKAAPDLKRAAGGTGAGATQEPALHYALYWGKRDPPQTREAAAACARASLSALGLQEHQALLFGHGDSDHFHVHVLVNRVHPVTGRVADVLTWIALNDWAKSYGAEPDIQPTSQLHRGPGSPDAA